MAICKGAEVEISLERMLAGMHVSVFSEDLIYSIHNFMSILTNVLRFWHVLYDLEWLD